MSLCSCVQHIECPYLLRCGTTMQQNTSVIQLSILSIQIRACICIQSLQPLDLCTECVHWHRDNAMIAMQRMLQQLELCQPPIRVVNPATCNTCSPSGDIRLRILRSSTQIRLFQRNPDLAEVRQEKYTKESQNIKNETSKNLSLKEENIGKTGM